MLTTIIKMVKTCFVCHKTDYLHQNLSFHRLRRDKTITRMWLTILKVQIEIENVPKEAYICSTHFLDTDFEYKGEPSRKFLKKGAMPIYPEVVDVESSLDSTIGGTPPKSAKISNLTVNVPSSDQLWEFVAVKRTADNISDAALDPLSLSTSENRSTSNLTASYLDVKSQINDNNESLGVAALPSSSPITASEAEIQIEKDDTAISRIVKPKGLAVIRKRRRITTINLSSSDFSTPRKPPRNFRSIKTQITRQQTEIRLLKQLVRRLRARVTTLSSLLRAKRKKNRKFRKSS